MEEEKKDYYNNKITQSVVVGFASLFGALSWATLNSFLFGSGYWLWSLLCFLILSIFLSLNWLLTKVHKILYISLFFVVITFFFSFGFKWQYFVLTLFVIAIFIYGSHRAVREGAMRINIEVIPIIKKGLPAILTGFAILIAGAYYFSPFGIDQKKEIKIPRPLFDVTVQPLIKTLNDQFPFFLEDIDDKSDLPFEAQASKERFSEISPNLEEKLYHTLNDYLNRASEKYRESFPLGFTLGVFLILKALAIPFMWIVVFFSWLIFKILIWTGSVKIQQQSVLKEIIKL